MNRTRLDAESVRDAVLAVSGKLDSTMGGPSVQAVRAVEGHPRHAERRLPEVRRRQPRRSPAQRLSLHLPHAARPVLGSARLPRCLAVHAGASGVGHGAAGAGDAERPLHGAPCGAFRGAIASARRRIASAQIARAYELALGRTPTEAEVKRLADYAEKHGLANACRLLFNCNEFLFVD